jgi:hypothetical protein
MILPAGKLWGWPFGETVNGRENVSALDVVGTPGAASIAYGVWAKRVGDSLV